MITLSIIIPCLNEQDNVMPILDQLSQIIKTNNINCEIILVDDQSIDQTYEKAYEWSLKNHEIKIKILKKSLDKRGYGATVKYGLAHAVGKYAVFVSADLVDPVELLPRMLEKLNSGDDLVQISRYLDKENSNTIPLNYKFFQVFFRLGVCVALGLKIPDSTYAFKMFNRTKILAMGIGSKGFNISPEIMFKAVLASLRISFISGAQGVRVDGVSKFKFHKEGIGFGVCLIRAFMHRYKIVYWF